MNQPEFIGELFDNNVLLHSIPTESFIWLPDTCIWSSNKDEGVAIYHLMSGDDEVVAFLEADTSSGYVSCITFTRLDKTPVGGFAVHDDDVIYADEEGNRLFQTADGLVLVNHGLEDMTIVMYESEIEPQQIIAALQGKVSSMEVVH